MALTSHGIHHVHCVLLTEMVLAVCVVLCITSGAYPIYWYMQNMFDGLKREHHLKHTGRLQLGNFLKVSLPHSCLKELTTQRWPCRCKLMHISLFISCVHWLCCLSCEHASPPGSADAYAIGHYNAHYHNVVVLPCQHGDKCLSITHPATSHSKLVPALGSFFSACTQSTSRPRIANAACIKDIDCRTIASLQCSTAASGHWAVPGLCPGVLEDRVCQGRHAR